jgi:hypothetical protein
LPRVSSILKPILVTALLGGMLILPACKGRGRVKEIAYVAAPQTFLRDHVATVYEKVGIVKNGDRLDVLERTSNGRFVRVRTEKGLEGWVEQRSLVDEDVFQGFQKLVQENAPAPVQAHGATHAETNLHLTPGRDTEHLYQIPQGEKVALIKRGTAERNLPGAAKSDTPKPVEDWWLVRDSQNHVGWVLARMVDLDVPLEIAQYAEGQRLVASFVLNEVADAGKKVPQYLVLFTEPKDGQPFDFNQIRVFTWNTRRHRYETAYREHRLFGVLPVTVGREDFGKEGNLPTFTLPVQDGSGQTTERKYKMNGVMVRKVSSR